MTSKEDNAKGDDDLRVRESRYIRKDGEGHISRVQEAAHTAVLKQILQEGLHPVAAYSADSPYAEDEEVSPTGNM